MAAVGTMQIMVMHLHHWIPDDVQYKARSCHHSIIRDHHNAVIYLLFLVIAFLGSNGLGVCMNDAQVARMYYN